MSVAAPTARRDEIVAAALDILQTEGPEHLTMRALAERLHIRAPSLYKHVADKDELRALLIAEALRQMGEALHGATSTTAKARRKALTSLGAAYRSWATSNPHLYRLATEGELPRDRLPEGLEAWTAEPLVLVMGSEAGARAVWAFAHGMTILELDGRFPAGADLDAAWAAGIAALAEAEGVA